MKKQEAINRLCSLANQVWERIDPHAQEPCDCFCGDNPLSHGRFVSDAVIEWIETAVLDSLPKIEEGEE